MKTGFEGEIWKTGNSSVVTIPAPIMKKYKLVAGKILVFYITDEGELVIKYIKKEK